jgi:hypothetical protein
VAQRQRVRVGGIPAVCGHKADMGLPLLQQSIAS